MTRGGFTRLALYDVLASKEHYLTYVDNLILRFVKFLPVYFVSGEYFCNGSTHLKLCY